jgi:hypothetical protein
MSFESQSSILPDDSVSGIFPLTPATLTPATLTPATPAPIRRFASAATHVTAANVIRLTDLVQKGVTSFHPAFTELSQKHKDFFFNLDPRKPFQTSSQAWDGFAEVCDENAKVPKVSCKHCHKTYQHPRACGPGGPTTTLSNHLKRHTSVSTAATAGVILPFVAVQTTYTVKQVEDLVVKFFITGNIAFAQAENPFFKQLIAMIKTATGMAKSPSRFTIRRRLKEGAQIALVDTRDQLAIQDGKVSIALDCWSTRNMLPYLGTNPLFLLRRKACNCFPSFTFHVTDHANKIAVTAHWIDPAFRIHEILLGFELLHGRHTGEHLASYVYDLLVDFALKSKLFCVTTDNATNNYTLTSSLESRLEDDDDAIVFDASEQHIPCVAHVLNLAVQTFLRNLKICRDEAESTFDIDDDSVSASIGPEKDFAVTIQKIREVTKV